jgi:wobble nucleotide-excising tRNase
VIAEIEMSNVASFKTATALKTDKRVNLVYGLNGTGKSTVSDFLYSPYEPRFSDCRTAPTEQDPILVYNQSFIRDHFYESDNLKGIFSLSKENKAAEEKISKAQGQLAKLQESLGTKQQEIVAAQSDLGRMKGKAANDIWGIKTSYCGGDRVLEYCLDGLKGQKKRLFSHVLSLPKPGDEPQVTIPQLKKDVEALKDASTKPLEELPEITFAGHAVESHPILGKAIIGNTDSTVAELIDRLENSDWVNEGLQYLPEEIDGQGSHCPFCQAQTVTRALVENIKEYFDDAYKADLSTLSSLNESYLTARKDMPGASKYTDHELVGDSRGEIEKLYSDCMQLLAANVRKLEGKLKAPRKHVALEPSEPTFTAFNALVRKINTRIQQHNATITDREASLDALKTKFWALMRWQYDQTVSRYLADKKEATARISGLEAEKDSIEKEISTQKEAISTAQKETVNIDQAVDNINLRLLDLGIGEFSIKKHSDALYRIVRQDQVDDAFHTLSEGEKMMISFLYFCELSLGRLSTDDTDVHRIAVIDDPISSMSHVYIFNVGQLIRQLFFQSNRMTQVFVFTHSLYFFYELTDTNHKHRKNEQKLFRIVKNSSGSRIEEMKYEEIQNDYQAYWAVVNDPDQPPALLANCMRNIIEYFFNFVKKRDLNNVFQMPELREAKYQAFCRYVNRESHSLGQNILDLKEFDYQVFREGLRLVFEKTGYPDHYEEMSRN